LQVRVAEVEEQIKAVTEPPKDCTNSLTPPSQSPYPNNGGFRLAWGTQAFGIIATTLQTPRKRGEDALSTLTGVLGSSLDPNLLSHLTMN